MKWPQAEPTEAINTELVDFGTSRPLLIAIVNPLGDYGINHYCHELAEGLGRNGARAVLYAGGLRGLPPAEHHEQFPVLNSLLLKQRATLANGRARTPFKAVVPPSSDRISGALTHPPVVVGAFSTGYSSSWLRRWCLTAELPG
jgi:hypothetical protein